MTRRSPRARSESGLWSAPAFPRPVGSFVGRGDEIDRILEHVDEDVMFFVYGVGGIGKTELVYEVIRRVRALPRWSDATLLHLDLHPDATATRSLTQLLAAAGAAPEPRQGQQTERDHLTEQLASMAKLLDARPHLVFIDDVHHLPPDQVAQALGYLSRHVRRSRLFVASRHHIKLAPDAPTPVVTTLGPLDRAAAKQLLTLLSERMQLPAPDADEVLRATHGSPFLIRRMLVRHGPDFDSLEATLDALSAPARRILMAAAVAQQRLSVAMLRDWFDEAPAALEQLEQRFLIDTDQPSLVLHDLIRDPLVDRSHPDQLEAAHLDAASLCLEQLQHGDSPSLICAADAISHLIAAGRPREAWQLVEHWHSALSAAGSEHLLRTPLEQLRTALPANRIAIDLMIARSLVRASLLEEADRVLSRVGDDRDDTQNSRYYALAGEIAQRRGQHDRADELFERAAHHAPDEQSRFAARMHSAFVAMFSGDTTRARGILDDALAGVKKPTARQRGRCSWSHVVSLICDDRFELAAAEAHRARHELANTGLADLSNRLAMLETLAAIEAEDMVQARAAVRLIDTSGLRRHVAKLYRAIMHYADGAAWDASTELRETFDYLAAQRDAVNAFVAGYYGSAALTDVGRLSEAQSLAERTWRLAHDAGLRPQAAKSLAQRAMLAAEAVQTPVAHRLADQALASKYIGPRSSATAHCAHSRAYCIEGDITKAMDHMARARAVVAEHDLTAAQITLDVELAGVELIGGNLERAVELSETAIERYKDRCRHYESVRTRLMIAASYIARGRRTDIVLAERSLEQARSLADHGKLRSLQVGAAILSAAIARRHNRGRAAEALLVDALKELDPERGSLYASTLLAAIEGGAAAWVVPGAVALLAHLGFTDAVDCYLVDQHGRRAATTVDKERERQTRELFVDETRSLITAQAGSVEIRGRPMQCDLLSVLVQARGEPVTPDALYKRVWGVDEYHPLHHRNALYVAINRLRKCLREALPERIVVERASSGWRIARDIDACAAVAVRGNAD